LDEVVKDIPMEYIILETDSPYLAPSPHRGKRNESAYMALVVDKLAEVKRMRIEEVAAITTSNAKELFNL
jgi:TatD DNase family protein